jgi:nucleotide-binding universal stress UspA family protein
MSDHVTIYVEEVAASVPYRSSEAVARTIVLAIEPSTASRGAIEWAAALAALTGSRLYVVHVRSRLSAILPSAMLDSRELDAIERFVERRVHAEVDSSRRRIWPPLIECVRFGRPAHEIAACAAELHADLVVVGTHARRGLSLSLHGSVAWEIVREAPCPVVVAPASLAPREPGAPLCRRVLVAIDGSEDARAATRAALSLADGQGAVIDAVHVIDAAREGHDDLITAGREGVLEWVEEAVPWDGARVTAGVAIGEPARVLSELATRGGYDLVACGTHGRTGVSRALFGSIAGTLTREAGCPVLIARV